LLIQPFRLLLSQHDGVFGSAKAVSAAIEPENFNVTEAEVGKNPGNIGKTQERTGPVFFKSAESLAGFGMLTISIVRSEIVIVPDGVDWATGGQIAEAWNLANPGMLRPQFFQLSLRSVGKISEKNDSVGVALIHFHEFIGPFLDREFG